MKLPIFFILLLCTSINAFSQNQSVPQGMNNKGKFYVYWGWNRGFYSLSDIRFQEKDFDFTLYQVYARDHPTHFDFKNYFSPFRVTIPQVNFRVGYFIDNHYSISGGFDHMKYVMEPNQVVKITGHISNTETLYDGTYENEDITLKKDFVQFEHTNGLNYLNVDFRRFDQIFDWNKVKINITEGLGTGILLPRTNTTLFETQHNDSYHLSGYGINGIVALNVGLFKFLFIQSELKYGYINMPDVKISHDNADNGSQNFFFTQANLLFGATFSLGKSKAPSAGK